MTTPDRPDGRALLGVVAALLVVAVAAVGGTSSGVTTALSPGERTATAGETVTFDVVASDVSDGVGAQTTVVELRNASGAELVAIEPAGSPPYNESSISENGTVARLDAAYGDDTLHAPDGGDGIVIATVSLETEQEGSIDVLVDVQSLADGDGERYEVVDSRPAALAVEPEPTPTPTPSSGSGAGTTGGSNAGSTTTTGSTPTGTSTPDAPPSPTTATATETGAGTTASTTPTRTATGTATRTPGTPTATDTATPPPTASPSPSASTTATRTPTGSDGPGFGAVAAVIGLFAAAALATRR